MRYRAEDADGDYTFGLGAVNFLVDSPQAVAQAIKTRLNLFLGEYGPDTTRGMDWYGSVLGYGTGALYDPAIKEQILTTFGVQSIDSYSSSVNRITRQLTIAATIQTIYGGASFSTSVPLIGGYGEGGYGQNPYGR